MEIMRISPRQPNGAELGNICLRKQVPNKYNLSIQQISLIGCDMYYFQPHTLLYSNFPTFSIPPTHSWTLATATWSNLD